MYFLAAGGMIEVSPLKLRHTTSMSTSNVVSLDERRGHREARLRLTLALYGVEQERGVLAGHLTETLDLTGADRGALVWIDEYGPGLVHAHCVLDLVSDRPRRRFSAEPLRRAWERGIPGLLDEPDLTASGRRILTESPRSLAAVALGSDGLRAWFLVVDSKTPRTALDAETVDALMFRAGECASIVIHDDLSVSSEDRALQVDQDGFSRVERERRSRFPGWPVLQDASDSTEDRERDRLVTLRFLVARLLRELADDDFAVDEAAFTQRVETVEAEAQESLESDRSGRWAELFQALRGRDHSRLAAAVLRVAVQAEKEGHLHGSRELHRLAYDVAVAGAHADHAVDAARFLGRVNRRLGSFGESERWYRAARSVAQAAGLSRGEALALDGLGNTYRVRGSLPRARDAYTEVLAMGEELEDPNIRGRGHQNLALMEKHAGDTDAALRHGWAAVQDYGKAGSAYFFWALGDLGDIFIRCGELDSAERAFRIVADGVDSLDIRAGSLAALAHVSALRGDRVEHDRRIRRLDEEPMEKVSIETSAEILLLRGLSHVALGESEAAETWLRRALRFSDGHGVTRILFEAEAALDELSENGGESLVDKELPPPRADTMSELEEPLHALAAPPVTSTP